MTKREAPPIRIGYDLLGCSNEIIDGHKLRLRGQVLLPLLMSLTRCNRLMSVKLRDLLCVHNLD